MTAIQTFVDKKNNLDEMLEKTLFEVSLMPIKLDPPSSKSTPFENLKIKNYMAVVNISEPEVLSIVSDQYQLITNKQAIEYASHIFKDTFKIDPNDQLNCINIYLSKRKTFCHIDLLHKNYEPVKIKQDTWLPFIRVTNSYNKTYPLIFHIGFHRLKCNNGMLFTKTIEIRQAHTAVNFNKKKSIVQLIPNYYNEILKFSTIVSDFKGFMEQLHKIHIPANQFEALIKKILAVKFPVDKQTGELTLQAHKAQERYVEVIKTLTLSYINELETTAYTALNILTDLVTHGNEYNCIPGFSTKIPDLNDKISNWVETFPIVYKEREFNWDNYLRLN